MARNCCYDWLVEVQIVEELPDKLCGVVAVHERHVTIHENQIVLAESVAILVNVPFDGFESLLAVESVITDIERRHVQAISHNYLDCFNVEDLIINYKNS